MSRPRAITREEDAIPIINEMLDGWGIDNVL